MWFRTKINNKYSKNIRIESNYDAVANKFPNKFRKTFEFAIEMHFVAYNFQTIPEHSIVLFTIIHCNVMCYVDTIWQTCHCSYGIRAHVHRELG